MSRFRKIWKKLLEKSITAPTVQECDATKV